MDKGLGHKRMCQVLKTEQQKHPALTQAVFSIQWDSEVSDTESLALERAQLQKCIDQNKYIMTQKEKGESLRHGDQQDEDVDNDETEDFHLYDSLDKTAHPHMRNSMFQETQVDIRERVSQLPPDDFFPDQFCDPNWRTKMKGSHHLNEDLKISMKESSQVPKEKSCQACDDRQGLVMRGGYSYTVSTSPTAVLIPHMAGNLSGEPFRLHPQDDQIRLSVSSSHWHNHTSQQSSPEADLSMPSSIFTKNESEMTSERIRKINENSHDSASEIINRSHELMEDGEQATYNQEFKVYRDLRPTQVGSTQAHNMSTSALSSFKLLSNKKSEKLTQNIVERNKITLGRNTSKCGSYVMMFETKQDMPHNRNKVTQISKGRKAEQKEHSSPPQQQPRAITEQEDRLSSPLERPVTVTRSKPQKTTISKPLIPTFYLNISLNTSSHLFSLKQQKCQDPDIDAEPLLGCPRWCPASEVEIALSPGYQQTNPGKSFQMSWEGINAQLHQIPERHPGQWQRTSALKWPLFCESEDQKLSPNKVYSKQLLQNLCRTPPTTWSHGLGSCTVLPPIGKPMMGKEQELSPGQSVDKAYPIHKSSSDSYLIQMEKQKLRGKVTYKAYSLKDYKQLKSDLNLQGLGPDYKAFEKTKMKRQRLYSNVVREENKKISRIPFLPAKDTEGSDKKVPRMKALEYAKTIAKPPQPKQRQKHQSEGFTEHTPRVEDLDMSQPATLHVLKKRHEEEKKAVALFRKVHAV